MGRTATIDPNNPDALLLREAAQLLRDGRLVAFPTETVYGLGANGLDSEAVGRIYEAKGRPNTNPVILHVSSTAQAKELVAAWPEEADLLAEAFWPGPLTMVLPKGSHVPEIVTAGGPTVAIRFPAHPVARALIEATGLPLAAPSANRSSEISPTRAEHVAKSLGDRIDLILDAGPTSMGIESTVIDLSKEPFRILRFGPLVPEQLKALLKREILWNSAAEVPSEILASPGMLRKHYSPHTATLLIDRVGEFEKFIDRISARERIGYLLRTWNIDPEVENGKILMPTGAAEYAERLYDALHRLDSMELDTIIVEMPPDSEEWLAVRDRLTRAAAK